jgi:hypothetical protein
VLGEVFFIIRLPFWMRLILAEFDVFEKNGGNENGESAVASDWEKTGSIKSAP